MRSAHVASIILRSPVIGTPMTRQLSSTVRQPPLHYLTRSVRRTSGFVPADDPPTGALAPEVVSVMAMLRQRTIQPAFEGTKPSFESASIWRCLPASRFSFCSFVGCLRWLQVHSPECWRPSSLGFRYEVSGRTLCLACWVFWCSS